MKFAISRTSAYDSEEEAPCEEAFRATVSYIKVHERTFKSFEEYDRMFGDREGAWLSKGTNHRLTEVGIARDEGVRQEEDWFIEIDSLGKLISFQQKYGDLVLKCSKDGNPILSIEIYDCYRE